MDEGSESLGRTLLKLGAIVATVFAGIAIKRGIEAVTRAAQDQENTFNNLSIIIRNTGVAYSDVQVEVEDFLSSLSDVTTFSDQSLAPALGQIVALTGDYKTSLESLETVLDASIGLQQNVTTVANLYGKAIQGNISGLAQYIPELRNLDAELFKTLDLTTRVELITALLAERYDGLARGEAKTFSGALQQLRNDFNEVLEELGLFIITSEALREIIEDIRDKFREWSEALKATREDEDAVIDASNRVIDVISGIVQGVLLVIDVLKIFGTVAKLAFQGFVTIVNAALNALGFFAQQAGRLLNFLGVESGTGIEAFGKELRSNTVPAIVEAGIEIDKLTGELDENISSFGDASAEAKIYFDSLKDLSSETEETTDNTKGLTAAQRALLDSLKKTGKEKKKTKTEVDKLNDSLEKQIENLKEELLLLGLEGPARNEVIADINREKGAREDLLTVVRDLSNELANRELLLELEDQEQALVKNFQQLTLTTKGFIEYNTQKRIAELQAQGFSEQVLEEVRALSELEIAIATASDEHERLKQAQEDAQRVIENFQAEFLGNIRDTFSELTFNIVKGNFDSIADLWSQTLDAMLRTFIDFLFQIAIQDIVLGNVRAGVTGGGGGSFLGSLLGGGGGNGILGLGGLFGGSSGGGLPGTIPLAGGVLPGLGVAGAGGGGIGGLIGSIGSVIGPLGAAVGLIATVGSILSGVFGSKSSLDIEVFGVGNEAEAEGLSRTVADVLRLRIDDAFRDAEIFIKEGGSDFGQTSEIKKIIADQLGETIDRIRNIVGTLPPELARQLDEILLSTNIDIQQLQDDVALEFDEQSKNAEDVTESFQQFLNGELQARFLTTISDFFDATFTALGVNSEAAERLINEKLAEIGSTEGREARAALGEAFLQNFEGLVNLFNLSVDSTSSSLNIAVNQIDSLAQQLGFSTIPTLEEIGQRASEIIANIETAADFEAAGQAADQLLALRNAILQLTTSTVSSITTLTGILTGLGGSAQLAASALQSASTALFSLLNSPGLDITERTALVSQLNGVVQQQIAIEQQAFQARIAAEQAALQASIQAIQASSRIRLDALSDELALARRFEQLVDNIKRTLDQVLFGPDSVLTGVEQIALLQARIQQTQSELQSVTDPDRQADLLETLANDLPALLAETVETFGANSPEAISAFEATVEGLKGIEEQAATASRSSESILMEIEALQAATEAQVAALNAQITALSNQQFVASQGLQEQINELTKQATLLLEENIAILEQQINESAVRATEAEVLQQTTQQQNTILETQTGLLSGLFHEFSTFNGLTAAQFSGSGFNPALFGLPQFQSGIDFVPRDSLAFIHRGEGVLDAEDNRRRLDGDDNRNPITIHINIDGVNSNIDEVMDKTKFEIRFGEIGEIIADKIRGRR